MELPPLNISRLQDFQTWGSFVEFDTQVLERQFDNEFVNETHASVPKYNGLFEDSK